MIYQQKILDGTIKIRLDNESFWCCDICNEHHTTIKDRTGKSLAVDHCHTTGEVRGLLCFGCNTALGRFKDDPTLLKNAIKYLQYGKFRK